MTEDEENKFIMRIRHKCRIAVLRYYSSQDENVSQEMRDEDWQMFLKNREEAISDSAQLTDDFSQGFALHSVVEMLTAAGEDQLARETLAEILDKSIKEEAMADFLAGPQACYESLLVESKNEVEAEKPVLPMSVPQSTKGKTWFKGWTSILPIAAFYIAYALFIPVGSVGRQWFENFTNTDADIRARIEREFTNDSKTYQILKKYYPQEYETLLNDTVADIRGNSDREEITRRGAEFTNKLRKLNAANYQMAAVESLREHLRSTLPQYEYVKSKYGFQACNAMSVGGGLGLLKVLGDGYIKDKTLLSLFDESSGIFFRMAAEGKTASFKHLQPTDADWQFAAQRMLDGGMTQLDFDMIADSQKFVNDPRLCDATIRWLQGIIALDGNSAERIIPFVAGEMAKG
jgi:hypothetical protein